MIAQDRFADRSGLPAPFNCPEALLSFLTGSLNVSRLWGKFGDRHQQKHLLGIKNTTSSHSYGEKKGRREEGRKEGRKEGREGGRKEGRNQATKEAGKQGRNSRKKGRKEGKKKGRKKGKDI